MPRGGPRRDQVKGAYRGRPCPRLQPAARAQPPLVAPRSGTKRVQARPVGPNPLACRRRAPRGPPLHFLLARLRRPPLHRERALQLQWACSTVH